MRNEVKESSPFLPPLEPGAILTDNVDYYMLVHFRLDSVLPHEDLYMLVSLTTGNYLDYPVNSIDKLGLSSLQLLPIMQQVTIEHMRFKG